MALPDGIELVTPVEDLFVSRNALQRGAGAHAVGTGELGGISKVGAVDDALETGWTDTNGESFFYCHGRQFHMLGSIGTPTTPTAGDVILTIPDCQPLVDSNFAIFNESDGAVAVVAAVAVGDGCEIRWVAGVHGAGKKLLLSTITWLDPWRGH